MSKSMQSPDSNVPLPFYGETALTVQPSDERVRHVASFMVDKTEPEHKFITPEQSVRAESTVRGIRPIYDVVLDSDASEAAQDQGWGRKPEFREPVSVTKSKPKLSHRPIENKYTGIGQEPPHFDPSAIIPTVTANNDEVGPGHQEARDLADKIAIQNIMIVHGVNYAAARNIHVANVERKKNR